jgi:heme-degrading monooxygenase HmoA
MLYGSSSSSNRVSVSQWPNKEAIKQWFNSDAMKPVREAQEKYTVTRLYLVEGRAP